MRQNRQIFRTKSILAVCLVATSLMACSRETVVFKEAADSPLIHPIEPNGLPDGFFDQSVGRASTSRILGSDPSTSVAISLSTSSGANANGGFNGPGVGSRSLLANSEWEARALAELSELSWEVKLTEGSVRLGALLQVDPLCDGSTLNVYEAKPASLVTTPLSDGYERVRVLPADSVWSPPGGGGPVSLSAILMASPGACLRSGKTGFAGLPKNLPTLAVLFSLGDENNTANLSVEVRKVVIGTDVHEGFE